FEPRYRAMISDAMARDRRIGMVQPRPTLPANAANRIERPALCDIGCVGKIAEFEASEDGRYNLILEGLSLFRIVRELDVATA
ncbi:LON peptidase substrate-binding domain-containing protein, partial [Escherichia coli]|uniref:LON peptidase substrate-binding domain-containing protein n=1 Tax=Escherichia coli TaxID=562 RepID=UPI003D36C1F4